MRKTNWYDLRIWPRLEIGDCWEWQGAKNAGYGVVGWREGDRNVTRRVHRLVWEFLVGEIPAGLHLDHLCRNPPCCNPDHLEPVTAAENLRRRPNLTRPAWRAKVCGNGHPWAENEWWPSERANFKYRRCLSCMRANWDKQREGKSA